MIISFFIAVWLMESCKKNDIENNPAATPLAIVIPPGFPPISDAYLNNPITQEGFDLGKIKWGSPEHIHLFVEELSEFKHGNILLSSSI